MGNERFREAMLIRKAADIFAICLLVWIFTGAFAHGFVRKRSLPSSRSPLPAGSQCADCKPPVLNRPLSNKSVSVGEKVVFRCSISGVPTPNITWYKNGSQAEDSLIRPPANQDPDKLVSKLLIKSAKLSDAGPYVCAAWNKAGHVTSNIVYLIVIVESTDFPPESQDPRHEHSTPDDSHIVSYSPLRQVHTTASDLDIPKPTIFPNTGSCVRYTGKLCSRIISRGKTIYVNSYNKQEHIEKKLDMAYKQISELERLGDKCRPYVLPLLCHYLFPYCNKSAVVPSPRQLCIDECKLLQTNVCAKEYKLLLLSSPSGGDTSLQPVLLPNCSALPPTGSAGWKGCIRFNVRTHVITKPIQKEDICFTGSGESYRGNVSVTENGYVCQRWNKTTPHHHLLSPSKYPELRGGHNFCRNPGGEKKSPWCFTTDPKQMYDFCALKPCARTWPEVKVLSILYMVIPCLAFAIVFASAVIFICWRCHKQIMYQSTDNATPLVPVVVKEESNVEQVRSESVRVARNIGEGQFGEVYLGEIYNKVDGRPVATRVLVKTLRLPCNPRLRESFTRQAATWSEFSHPNVIKILGICSQGSPTCVLYESPEYGTLHEYLLENQPVMDPESEEDPEFLSYQLLSIAIQVAAGMNYLSSKNFVHGDLACRNFLMGPRQVVKITDIALSREPYAHDYYHTCNRPPMPVRWMAPEGILNYKFTVETDIWSFGVVLWEIFSFGEQPYDDQTNEEVVETIREHVLLPSPEWCPARVYTLITECWDILPPSRPRFRTLYTQLCALRCEAKERVIIT